MGGKPRILQWCVDCGATKRWRPSTGHQLPCTDTAKYLANNIITVTHNNILITSGLSQQILTNLHYDPLKQRLKKEKQWTENEFLSVDWQSYHKAILSVPRSQRVSITKLSQGLWNTNEQDRKFTMKQILVQYAGRRLRHCPISFAAPQNRQWTKETHH